MAFLDLREGKAKIVCELARKICECACEGKVKIVCEFAHMISERARKCEKPAKRVSRRI